MNTVERPVLVAVPTYRRTERLAPLIAAIREQVDLVGVAVRIVVVDNDPDRSAETSAAAAGADYVAEPRAGIGATRQTALAAAEPGELVAMLDDDVMPEPGWLAALLEAHRTYAPTVVMGYVRYVWPAGCDPWIVAGGFMRRRHDATGTRLSALSTGNVLLDPDAVRDLGVDFDPSLGLSGGEDSLFGHAVLAAGGTIVASAESVVRDVVPADRATRSFVRRRTIAHGEALVAQGLRGRRGFDALVARTRAIIGAAVRWTTFTAVHVGGKATSNTRVDAVATRRAWFARGRLRGALGRQTAEYGRDTSAPVRGAGRRASGR